MKALINNLAKGMAGVVFLALLAVNVQIGTDSTLFSTAKVQLNEAKAKCPPKIDGCMMIEFPDGPIYIEVGQPIVVTPVDDTMRTI